MSYPGQFMLVTVNKVTGAHTIHNSPSLNYPECIQVAQSMGPVGEHCYRQLFLTNHKSKVPKNDKPS